MLSGKSAAIFGIIHTSREAVCAYPPSEASCEAAARAVRGVIVRKTERRLCDCGRLMAGGASDDAEVHARVVRVADW